MKTLRVDLDARAYEIRIAPGLLDAAGEHLRGACPQAARLFVVTDSTVGPLYRGRVEKSLTSAGFRTAFHTVAAGESSKCASRLSELWFRLSPSTKYSFSPKVIGSAASPAVSIGSSP